MDTHREPPLAVEHNDIRVYAPLRAVLDHLQEFPRQRLISSRLPFAFPSRRLEVSFNARRRVVPNNAPNGVLVPLVYTPMLLVQRAVEDDALDPARAEHRLHERLEADVPVPQRGRDWARELDPTSLEGLDGGEARRERGEVAHEYV